MKLRLRAPDDRQLLGVHIIGERATELVHIGQALLHLGGTHRHLHRDGLQLSRRSSELYKYAAYDGLGKLARFEALLGTPEPAEPGGLTAPPRQPGDHAPQG